VLFTDADPEQKDAFKWHVSSKPYVIDVATRKREPLADFPENATCVSLALQQHPDLLKKDTISADDHATPT
jgi:hypothetical protein